MYAFIKIIHITAVVILILLILAQRGRSGGLVEALGGVESIFGTKTNSMMVRATVVLAIVFFATSITLTYLSKEQNKSVIERVKISQKKAKTPAKKNKTADTNKKQPKKK